MDDIGTLFDVASKITIVGVLLVIIVGGAKKQWVFGWLYDQMVASYDKQLTKKDEELAKKDAEITEWKQRALDQLGVNKDTVDSLKKLVSQAGRAQTSDIAKGGPTG